ncbi:MAG: NAD kinase [Saprospiraceae bacterium]|nr:NAD kinase [Saprospiraceae bacterium]
MKWLIYGHSIKDAAEYEYVNTVISTAVEYDVELCVFRPYLDELIRYNPEVMHLATIESSSDLITQRPDIMITLGGDGTILQAITLLKDSGIPVLGINLGRLGFLASVEKKIIKKAVKQLINKEYTTVSRSLLGLKCNLPLFDHFPFALNDFTLNKRDTSSMITIHTYIDNVLLNSYWADGIIISTPTGSTGYSLSCGGPIIFPDSQNIVITPVAPHNLNVRPIVIPDTLSISLKVEGRTDSFMCTLDSRYETITSAHRIEINKGNFFINFVQLKGQTFMKTISEKLLWGLDKRN